MPDATGGVALRTDGEDRQRDGRGTTGHRAGRAGCGGAEVPLETASTDQPLAMRLPVTLQARRRPPGREVLSPVVLRSVYGDTM